ncbi:hypothetical protein Tco_1309709 [Tanacetum coccineum]
MIEDESLDMIVDEPLMVEDKSLEKLVDETLKLDEEHFEYNLETRIEHLEKDYKAKAANEVQDPSVGQCKVIFADNKALTDEASSKGTTEL